jgi:hypothetical protein
VHLEDLAAVVELGERDDDLAVEPARTQQGRVEDVGPVGRCHHHDAGGDLEPVHLGEHLVERLLPLVVATAETGAALAADGVDLVDEDDGPAHLAGGLEQVAHPAGADADEHLHEVRAGDRQERHARLAGDGPGDEGLAGAGRPDQQHALGDAGADLGEPLRVLQEVDDLGDVLLDALVAGHVGEGRARTFRRVGLGLAAADGHDAAHLALGPALHPHEEADEQGHRQQQRQQCAPQVLGGRGELHALLGHQRLIGVGRLEGCGGGEVGAVVEGAGDVAVGVVERGVGDLVGLELAQEVAVADLVARGRRRHDLQEDGAHHDGDEHQDRPARPPLVGAEPAPPTFSAAVLTTLTALTGGWGGGLGAHAPSLDGGGENPCQLALKWPASAAVPWRVSSRRQPRGTTRLSEWRRQTS